MHLLLFAALALTIGPVQPGLPDRQPQLAADSQNLDLVFGSGTSIWLVHSKLASASTSPAPNSEAAFTAPVQVASVPALALGRHRGPRIAIAGRALVVSAVYGNAVSLNAHAHGLPANGDLVAWRSFDQGKTWSQPSIVNDVPGAAREGLHAMAAGPSGEVAAVWLDLRAKGTRLVGAYSHDAGATWSKNATLYQAPTSSPDATICQCCHPSLVYLDQGRYAVMFRNVVDGSRDLYSFVWTLQGGPSQPVKMGLNSWKLNACPMDGGGLASDGRKLISAWRRDESVYLADTQGHEQVIGQGKNVALAITAKGPYVAWANQGGIQVKLPGVDASAQFAKGGDFPSLLALPDGRVAVSWEQDGQILLQILR